MLALRLSKGFAHESVHLVASCLVMLYKSFKGVSKIGKHSALLALGSGDATNAFDYKNFASYTLLRLLSVYSRRVCSFTRFGF